jgi:hypothetical protein
MSKARFLIFVCLAFCVHSAQAALIEAESVLATKQFHGSDGQEDRKLTAFGGACLGNGWGVARGDWAQYETEGGGAMTLHLRYARHPISGQRQWSRDFQLKAKLGDIERTISLPFTGDWELWRWVQIPIGDVPAGKQTLRIESLTENAPINIDALALAPAEQTPPEVARPLLFDGSKHLRIQLSPSMGALEMDKLFAVGEASYAFLKEYLGEEPSQRILINIIGPTEKRNDHVGHSIGYSMYLEGARIHETGHNWVHEMTHCFQRDSGPWNTWLSEAEAWLTSYESETAVFGDAAGAEAIGPAAFAARLPRYQAALIVDNRNLIQFWGTPQLPREKISAAYGFTNYLLGQLRLKSDAGLMKRYRALLKEDAKLNRPAPATLEERDALIVDRLGRAAGQDFRPLFEEWRFRLSPPNDK